MTRAVQISAKAAEHVLEIDAIGTKRWRRNGRLHRDDGPAVEYIDGTKEWYRHGRHHREAGPAVEWANGSKMWYHRGQLHREDGPSIQWADGGEEWYLHGKYYTTTGWIRERLKDRPLTIRQSDLLDALIENWDGTPDLLYTTVTHLAG